MQNSSEKTDGKLDESSNGAKDSPMMTIEYLRARLLAERSVCKAEKERADELANRVSQLEEQMKIVILQRKRAEKANLGVLSYLESHGVSNISVCESDSDVEESLYDSSCVKCDTHRPKEQNSGCSEKGNDGESSGSDHDSTPSSGRSLSWKGHMESTQRHEKKSFGSSFNRRTNLPLISSSPRHRSGRSCRKNKRRELRAAVEEAMLNSVKTDSQSNNTVDSLDNIEDSLDRGNKDLERSPGERFQRGLQKNEDSLLSPALEKKPGASSSCNLECGGVMERALVDQAQLIRYYEAQEKAQRDWEEKYGDTNISTPDSCEPGNHSDVTEEREENKATALHPTRIVTGHGHNQRAGIETRLPGKEPSITHLDNFKYTSHADTRSSQNYNVNEPKDSTPLVPDFAFSVVNSTKTSNHGATSSLQSVEQSSLNFQRPSVPTTSSSVGGIFSAQPENSNRNRALIPQEEPHGLGNVLKALQEAKAVIKWQMNSSPETSGSVSNAVETPALANRDVSQFQMPFGCPGLFRLPTELPSQPSQSRLLGTQYPLELAYPDSGSLVLQGPQETSNSRPPMEPRYGLPSTNPFSGHMTGTVFDSSHMQPRYDPHFNTSQSMYSTFPPYSIVPNSFTQATSNQISYELPHSEVGISSSGSALYHGQDGRPNVYR